MNGDMREEYEPFLQDGQWWYWQIDDTRVGPFKTQRAAQMSANAESLTMFSGEE
jgi:hypothetical protein